MLLKKTNIFCDFFGGGGGWTPCLPPPPSGSVHVVKSIEIKYKQFPFNVEKTAAVVRQTVSAKYCKGMGLPWLEQSQVGLEFYWNWKNFYEY